MKFLLVSAFLALAAPSAFGQELKVTLSQNVTFQGKDILATQVLLTFPPGDQGIGPHTHSGPVVGYVIEGELLFQVEGQNPTILKAGSAFFEEFGAIHLWGGNASNSTVTKAVATVYGMPNEMFVTMRPDKTRDDYETALSKARKQEHNKNKN